jgi:galactose mutarotase-like enzyme
LQAQGQLITLQEGAEAKAVVAPELGGWLLRYMRHVPGRGYVDVLHFREEVVDRYPSQMYAGNPVLFPLVSFNIAGGQEHFYEWPALGSEQPPTRFPMAQHGFARKSKWKVAAFHETSVRLELTENEQTLAVYPFAFLHELEYRLEGGRLFLSQKVVNRSRRVMPFSSGFHPYFQVPFTGAGARNDCFCRMPAGKRMLPHGKMESFTAERFTAQDLPLGDDYSGTMFLADLEKREASLIDSASGLSAVLNWEKAPAYRFLALWSKSTEEPFFCIEPWTALPNSFGRSDGELILLAPDEEFEAGMWLDLKSS